MRWCAFSFAAGLTFAGNATAADPGAWLNDEVPARLAAADIPAAIIALVHDDTTTVTGYGADAQTAVFRVGSVSKPVTASIVLAMTATGTLDPDRDLRPALAALPLRPALQSPLTLHHLLTHTAGFNERLFGQHAISPDGYLSLHDYLQQHLPPRFIEPGEVIAYNDHHTALAAWVAQQAGGETFDALARRHVFSPLGMINSSFAQIDLPPRMVEQLAVARTGIGGTAYPRDFIQLPPAAGLYTTAPDMARYMRALLTDALPGADRQLAPQFRHHPAMPGRTYGFAEGHHGSMRYLYKDGQASGFNARMLLLPEQGFGLFVAHNRNIFGAFGSIEPAGRFNRVLGADLLAQLWPIAADEHGAENQAPSAQFLLTPYAGTYRTVIAARHTWERLASLFDEATISVEMGTLRLGSQRYAPQDETLFTNTAHPGNHIAFRSAGETITHVFIGGGAYERVPVWTSQAALPWVVGLPLLVLLVCGARLIGMELGRVLLGHATLITFFIGLAVVFWLVDTQNLFHGPPAILLGLLALPLLALFGFTLQLVGLGRPRRVARVFSITAATMLFMWLWHWNLLGYWLG